MKHSGSTAGGPQKPAGSIFQPAECQFPPLDGRMAARDYRVLYDGNAARSCSLRMHLLSFFTHILEKVSCLFPGRTPLPYGPARRDTELPDSSMGASAAVFLTTRLPADRCWGSGSTAAVSPSPVQCPLRLLPQNGSDSPGSLDLARRISLSLIPSGRRQALTLNVKTQSYSSAVILTQVTHHVGIPLGGKVAAGTRRREARGPSQGRTAACG